jgi:L-ribulose-5-phosphate 4-epimerase
MFQYEYCKVQIVETAQILVKKGYLMATGGNLSMRVPGESVLVITPSNFDYMKMTTSDICVLNFKLDVIEGELTPSVESAFHAGIYQTRGDVNAIIHTHQVYPSALALMNVSIPALFDEQVRYLGRSVEIIPYAPSGTEFLKKKIVKHIKDHHNAYIMQNHGALCFGESMQRAIYNVEILEKCSLAYLLTLCAEREPSKIPLPIREIAFAKLRKDQKKLEGGEDCKEEA